MTIFDMWLSVTLLRHLSYTKYYTRRFVLKWLINNCSRFGSMQNILYNYILIFISSERERKTLRTDLSINFLRRIGGRIFSHSDNFPYLSVVRVNKLFLRSLRCNGTALPGPPFPQSSTGEHTLKHSQMYVNFKNNTYQENSQQGQNITRVFHSTIYAYLMMPY